MENNLTRYEENTKKSLSAQEAKRQESFGALKIGRSRGLLAVIVNNVQSGSLYIMIIVTLQTLFHSKELGSIFFVLLSFLLIAAVYVLFIGTFQVVYSRIFLEARTYEKIPFFSPKEEMRKAADEVVIVTDDGSYGRKCLVTEPLKEFCELPEKPDEVVIIGPPIMMKFAALATKPYGVKTIASLNSIMIDGTGMCGGCRVTVGGQTKFVCVDGPEFDAHQVDFDNFIKRLGSFKKEEADHRCRSGLFAK